jgi:hypothetical protein
MDIRKDEKYMTDDELKNAIVNMEFFAEQKKSLANTWGHHSASGAACLSEATYWQNRITDIRKEIGRRCKHTT